MTQQHKIEDPEIPSPLSYKNWRLMDAGNHCTGRAEFKIFTDAHIIGETEVGPFKFMNTLAVHNEGSRAIRPAVVIRVSYYWPQFGGLEPYEKTEADHYHGGDHFDEVAALISLILGVRAQAGNACREFRPNGDPLGQPIEMKFKQDPFLLPLFRQPQIRRLQQSCNLTDIQPIEKFSQLTADEANVLIKVARLYQQALWLVDAQPEIAWLLFVSAIEAAAVHWWMGTENSLSPELEKIIKESGCEDKIREPLTTYMKRYTGAGKKFTKFLLSFLPVPPVSRPEIGVVDFTNQDALENDFRIIYDFRSKALHGGIAFPAPMCEPPMIQISEEKPISLGMRTRNAKWWYADTPMPMLLHVFEHIARGSILNWMQSMQSKTGINPPDA